MAIKPVRDYALYTWAAPAFIIPWRKKYFTLKRGMVFGLRPAFGKKGGVRMIILEEGATKVHTPSADEVLFLVNNSRKKRG